MSETRLEWMGFRSSVGIVFVFLLGALVAVSAEQGLDQGVPATNVTTSEFASIYLWQNNKLMYQHIWPEMKFSWQIVLGTIVSFFAAAFGSVGGVGGGGIFVPMLTLIIGFDPKTSTAISKCMITGAAGATVYYNLRLRHPSLDLPLIDYDLALLFQPMLVLGISIGVAFNVIFADWMVTVLLILLFTGTSTKAVIKGVETWKKETIMKQEAAALMASYGASDEPVHYKLVPGEPRTNISMKYNVNKTSEVRIVDNIRWKELSILFAVWGSILFLHIIKNYTTKCSLEYWALNLLQIPIAIGASAYAAVGLYKGKRTIASRGEAGTDWSVHQLVLCCLCGILAGIVGGLLGLGGGFILGPLFLELGVPPQVSSATATFAMTFSSSMSVVQYYLLKRFPVPHAIYFVTVATIAALVGQHVVRKIVSVLGRASLIIFILAFIILVSAISLGGVGITDMIDKIIGKKYIGFDDICAYDN